LGLLLSILLRLKKSKWTSDYWFKYDKFNILGNVYEKLAKKIIKLIDTQAELYWKEKK
jgi:ferritin-like protein